MTTPSPSSLISPSDTVGSRTVMKDLPVTPDSKNKFKDLLNQTAEETAKMTTAEVGSKKFFKPKGSDNKNKEKTVVPPRFGHYSGSKSPSSKKTFKSKSPKYPVTAKTPQKSSHQKNVTKPEESDSESEVFFEDYSKLCERVAKTMYYANPRPPTTPRPSLPLTILAVDTFSKFARKDTLAFLDIDMAAEIGRNACVSPTALVFAMVYLERLSVNKPGYLKTVKPSELFVVSLLVASKFIQDDGEDLGIFNDEWATSANMELKKVNQLELEFLTAIDWHINIGKDEYERALTKTEEKIALYQGAKRGWFTYTELKSLANGNLSYNAILPVIFERIVEVVSGICVMYTTFFATLITSSVLAPYLLSVSKIILLSSVSNSFLTGSSLSSCSEDISNASIPLTQDITNPVSIPIPNIPGYVPAERLLLASALEEEEEENSTELNNPNENLGQAWQKPGQNHKVMLHNNRGYETANANFGYSFKCESNLCHENYQEQVLTNVQRVLENLLHSGKMPNDMKTLKRQFEPNSGLHCVTGGICAM